MRTTVDDLTATRVQDDLTSYFSKSANTVMQLLEIFEKNYARPAMHLCVELYRTRPIISTFGGILVLLSFFPVVSFIALSLFVFSSFMFFALSSALLAFVAIEIIFVTLLASTLVALFFLSLPLTIFVVGVYFATRLVGHIRTDGRQGISEWVHETREHLGGSPPTKIRTSRDSDVSGVLVETREEVQENMKVETTG